MVFEISFLSLDLKTLVDYGPSALMWLKHTLVYERIGLHSVYSLELTFTIGIPLCPTGVAFERTCDVACRSTYTLLCCYQALLQFALSMFRKATTAKRKEKRETRIPSTNLWPLIKWSGISACLSVCMCWVCVCVHVCERAFYHESTYELCCLRARSFWSMQVTSRYKYFWPSTFRRNQRWPIFDLDPVLPATPLEVVRNTCTYCFFFFFLFFLSGCFFLCLLCCFFFLKEGYLLFSINTCCFVLLKMRRPF